MSFTLFKTTFKKNWMLLAIISGVMMMYMGVMLSMYNPADTSALMDMLKVLPESLLKAMGFSAGITEVTGFLASWLYGMLMFALPMIYAVILGNKLVAKMVDNGSFAYLLSTPNSRTKIIVTQCAYSLLSLTAMFTVVCAFGVILSEAMFPGLLRIGAFIGLNVTTLLVNMAVMMISFFFSCLFNSTKMSYAFGAGIPIAFLLMNMLGSASEKAAFLRKITLFGLHDPIKVIEGSGIPAVAFLYIAVILVLGAASVLIFRKKQLPL